MIDDPIVAEVRATRESHAAAFGFDLEAIFRDLKQSEAKRDPKGSPLVEHLEPVGASSSPPPQGARFARR